jgi:hypothetical protein
MSTSQQPGATRYIPEYAPFDSIAGHHTGFIAFAIVEFPQWKAPLPDYSSNFLSKIRNDPGQSSNHFFSIVGKREKRLKGAALCHFAV